MQNIALATKPSCQTTGSVDVLKDAVTSIVAAMTSDYGESFKRTFTNDEEIRNLKRRLYSKLRGLPVDCIVDGYEACIAKTPKFCPTVPDIVSHVVDFVKDREQRIDNQLQAQAIAALPAPTITAQPERVLDLLRKAQQTPKGDDEARAKRMSDLLQMHNALIAADKAKGLISKGPDVSSHLCEIEFCRNAGVTAHGRGGSFYCAEHFQR